MFELSVFLRDKLIGRSSFTNEEVRIGRSPDNEVQIDNLALSRYHASIEVMNGVHVLKDFGSQNGTYLNGDSVTGRRGLNDGDRIGIGKFMLLFKTDGSAAKSAMALVRDEASYAVAGETLVTHTESEVRERTCPFVGYLETMPPPESAGAPPEAPTVYPLAKDIFVIGSAAGADLVVDKAGCPERAAAIIRGWRGFSILALAPGVKRRSVALDLREDLAPGEILEFGTARYRFHAGRPEAGP